MKNAIIYYYDIFIDEYKKKNDKIIFIDKKNNYEYEFIEYYDDPNKLLNLYSLLRQNNILRYELILNKNNEIITNYDKKIYVLLKKNNLSSKRNLNFTELLNKNYIYGIKQKNNWKELWKQKNDYYEKYLDEIKFTMKAIKESFSYYYALSELAINILNYVNYNNINYTICHKRIEKIDDLYHPLNVVIDNPTRDIAEFIKNQYINDKLTIEEILNFLNNNIYTKDESILLFARLVYPSYYFDMYEKICFYSEKEENIKKIIKKSVHYETLLKSIYKILKNRYNFIIIDFFEN